MRAQSRHVAEALETLIPMAYVALVDAGDRLGSPREMKPKERRAEYEGALKSARAECAARLLRAMNTDPSATIGRGDGGAPVFPVGTVGSFSSKGSLVVGAIAADDQVRGIGIDLELTEGADPALEGLIGPHGVPAGMPVTLATHVAFAAREAVFKAQFPLTGLALGLEDVEFVWEPQSGSAGKFLGSVRPASLPQLPGGYAVSGPWVATAAWVPRDSV